LHTELRRLRSNSLAVVRALVAAGANLDGRSSTDHDFGPAPICSPLQLIQGMAEAASPKDGCTGAEFFEPVLNFMQQRASIASVKRKGTL